MTTISVDNVTPTEITLSWEALTNSVQNGGDDPIFYGVEWLNSANGLWTELNTGGALATIYTHTYSTPPFPGGST